MGSDDDLRDLVKGLVVRVDQLERAVAERDAVIGQQQRRIEDLEGRVKRDSRTSSKPPSSDAPWSKRRRDRKPPSEKKRGAQPGHPGTTRPLVDEGDVDKIQDHHPDACSACGHDELVPLARSPHRHQVSEIPPQLVTIVEHRLHRALCRRCGETVTAPLPAGVTRSPFGPRLQALVASFSGVYRLSRREARRLLTEVFGVTMSPGTVSAIEARVSDALSVAHAEALGSVRTDTVLGVDETPWHLRGELHWLWTAVGADAIAHRIDRRRNAHAMRRLIGKRFAGVLVTDRMGAYDKHALERRQLCWAHIERDLRALAEGPRGGRRFGRRGVEIAGAVMRAHRRFAEHGDRERMQHELQPVWERLVDLLARGADDPNKRVRGTSRHLIDRAEALLTFADVPGVSPTNNSAERAVRKPVLWRRGCFGSQSERGLRFAERMLTVTATIRRRGENVFDYLAAVSNAAARGRAPPALVTLPTAR